MHGQERAREADVNIEREARGENKGENKRDGERTRERTQEGGERFGTPQSHQSWIALLSGLESPLQPARGCDGGFI